LIDTIKTPIPIPIHSFLLIIILFDKIKVLTLNHIHYFPLIISLLILIRVPTLHHGHFSPPTHILIATMRISAGWALVLNPNRAPKDHHSVVSHNLPLTPSALLCLRRNSIEMVAASPPPSLRGRESAFTTTGKLPLPNLPVTSLHLYLISLLMMQ